MADGFDAVDPREFDALMAQAAADDEARKQGGQPQAIRPMERKLFFEKSFRPPVRRVPCLFLKIGGRDFNCPVLTSYDMPDQPTHKRCVILIVEKPRIITTVAAIPRSELEQAPEVEVPY